MQDRKAFYNHFHYRTQMPSKETQNKKTVYASLFYTNWVLFNTKHRRL